MEYQEILRNAKENMGGFCLACPICNGLACKTKIPGPGRKGTGDAYTRNFAAFGKVKINMDTLFEQKEISTELEMFGEKFRIPVFAAPIGAPFVHYGTMLDDEGYSKILFEGCREAGILAFGGDGPTDGAYSVPLDCIRTVGGYGIPTIKPWTVEEMLRKIRLAEEAGVIAIATDVDGSGLAILKKLNTPVAPKSVADLKTLVQSTDRPLIVKGVMTAKGARKAVEAGAYGIVVSNHGGRVLDQTPATIEVLPEIAEAVRGKIKIFIDGGIRSGLDIFKCLALGADAVLIARPFATMVYGGGKEAIQTYVQKLRTELTETMEMAGASSLSEIDPSMVRMHPPKAPPNRTLKAYSSRSL